MTIGIYATHVIETSVDYGRRIAHACFDFRNYATLVIERRVEHSRRRAHASLGCLDDAPLASSISVNLR